jgi:hypothetical protein
LKNPVEGEKIIENVYLEEQEREGDNKEGERKGKREIQRDVGLGRDKFVVE